MKKSLFFVSLFSLSANLAFSQQGEGFDASKLKITWQLTENNYKKSGEMLSVVTLTNNSDKMLPAKGWTTYFNAAIPHNADADSTLLQVKMINGDYVKLFPGKAFKGLAPKASIKVKLLSRALKDITDYPKGFYIVFNNKPEKATVIKSEMKTLLDYSVQEKKLAEKHFQQNATVKDLPLNELPPVFPTPVSYTKSQSAFILGKSVKVEADPVFANEAAYLAKELEKVTGLKPAAATDDSHQILLQKKALSSDEAYELSVSENKIVISASAAAGAFYGIQSLKSLLPANAWNKKESTLQIPGVEIKDSPRFGYRAFMMDVARNFQQKSEVLKLIDLLSLYKVNVLHFHLNDDEGWRVEIPGLPELTQVGSKRGHTTDEKTHLFPSYGSGESTSNSSGSGFFSKADYLEILRYATTRHITVIPEFETPGHARAAIKSMNARYDRLMKAGDKTGAEQYLLRDLNDKSVYRSVQGWNDNVINPALPSVYTFLEKVTDEMISIYKEGGAPLQTIHFGGDEVPAGVWEKSPLVAALLKKDSSVQGVDEIWHYYFANVNAMLKKKGLYLSGWEETGLKKALVNGKKRMVVDPRFVSENFHTDVWNNLSGNEDLAYKLANAGYKVVLTNVTNMYLDLAYNQSYNEPGQYWGGYVDVDKPFSFIPMDYYKNQKENERGQPLDPAHFKGLERLTDAGKANIIGLQAPLWSEIITSPERFEYLLLPKVLGLAERAWAADPEWAQEPDAVKSEALYQQAYVQFLNVLGKKELPRLNHYAGGFSYRIPTAGLKATNGMVSANVQYPGFVIRYTTDGSEPGLNSKTYTAPLSTATNLSFRVFNAEGRGGRTVKFVK